MANVEGKGVAETRVLVVDDQMLYREGLVGLMGHWPEFNVVGDVANGREAVCFCRENRPDLVLMDVQMPVMGGIEATRIIHDEMPSVLVVMLTVSVDEDTLLEAFCSGAVGYVLKDTPSVQLRAQLQAVLRGDVVLSSLMTEKLVKRLVSSSSAAKVKKSALPGIELTDREKELLRLVAQGLSNDEIAARMYVSFGTVKKNLQALMQKLGLPNRVMLAGFAIRSGLAD